MLIGNNQVIIFDILYKKIIGLINLKLKVENIKINYEGIYIIGNKTDYNTSDIDISARLRSMTVYKNNNTTNTRTNSKKYNLLVFTLKDLKLIYKLENIVSNYIKYCEMSLYKCALILRQKNTTNLEIIRCKINIFIFLIYYL